MRPIRHTLHDATEVTLEESEGNPEFPYQVGLNGKTFCMYSRFEDALEDFGKAVRCSFFAEALENI